MNDERFYELVEKFQNARIAVLGDFFLDLYIHLDRSLSELSLETNKEAFQAINLVAQPGAAGVVTNNLTALGAKSTAVAYIGSDGNGYSLEKALSIQGVNTNYLIKNEQLLTPTYIKPMMQEVNGYFIELNRMDIKNRSIKKNNLVSSLINKVREAFESHDGILIVEQVKEDGFGVLSQEVRKVLTELSISNPSKPIVVDSRHHVRKYNQVYIKVNLSEALFSLNSNVDMSDTIRNNEEIKQVARDTAIKLWQRTKRPVFITLGENGITSYDGISYTEIPAYKVEGPIDIVGAGDSVLAGIGLALCVGATPAEAAFIGNLVGSITVQQIGTTGTANMEDLINRYKQYKQQ